MSRWNEGVTKTCLVYLNIIFIVNQFQLINCYNQTLLSKVTNLLTKMLKYYDKNFRPTFYEKAPVIVTVDISVRSMGPILEKDMEFAMNCYFRQRWIDERLEFKPIDNQSKELMLSAKFLNDIWHPDTYFRNGRKSYHHELTTPNTLVRVKSTGEVQVSQRITIKTQCPMHLKKFPMDSQACLVELGSLGHNIDELMFIWKRVPQADSITLSQYKLVDTIATQKNVSSFKNAKDTVSTLSVYFQLKREKGYYILQLYTPCTLMVITSWVSFWLNKEASPARVALGVMTVLAMSTVGLEGRSDLPRVSYSTALDVYITVCFGFVFFSLVEYAVINFAHFVHIRNVAKHMRVAVNRADFVPADKDPDICQLMKPMEECVCIHKPEKRKPWFKRLNCISRKAKDESESKYEFVNVNMISKKRRSPISDPDTAVDWIDDVSRILFPVSYILFNVLYWLAYLYWIPDEIYNIPAVREKFEQNLLPKKSSPFPAVFDVTNETMITPFDDNESAVNFSYALV